MSITTYSSFTILCYCLIFSNAPQISHGQFNNLTRCSPINISQNFENSTITSGIFNNLSTSNTSASQISPSFKNSTISSNNFNSSINAAINSQVNENSTKYQQNYNNVSCINLHGLEADYEYFESEPSKHEQNLSISCNYRPIVFWNDSLTPLCFYIFSQGPCSNGSWLVPDKNLKTGTCELNPCTHLSQNFENSVHNNSQIFNLKNEDNIELNSTSFAFTYGGKCYQSGYQGFCRNASHNIYFEPYSTTPLCSYKEKCTSFTLGNSNLNSSLAENGNEGVDCESWSKTRKFIGRCRNHRKNKGTISTQL